MPSAPTRTSASISGAVREREPATGRPGRRADQPMADVQALLGERAQERAQQVGAMDLVVGKPNASHERVAEGRLEQRAPSSSGAGGRRGRGPHRAKLVGQPEAMQHARRVGADLDARADLAQSSGTLVDADVESSAQERERRRESADAAADDRDLHRPVVAAGGPIGQGETKGALTSRGRCPRRHPRPAPARPASLPASRSGTGARARAPGARGVRGEGPLRERERGARDGAHARPGPGSAGDRLPLRALQRLAPHVASRLMPAAIRGPARCAWAAHLAHSGR